MPKATINPELVRDLASLLDETGLTEIEYETGTFRVRVSRQSGVTVAATAPAAGAAAPVSPPSGNGEAAPKPPAYDASHPGAISSPMVGTVYTAPEPGADEFVRVGEHVTAGQTLLLIEAMKTFNEIRAPRAGTVVSILIGNEQPVEYGDVLMILE